MRQPIIKTTFDLFFAVLGLVILLPLFIVIILIIIADSRGGGFYKQIRVGKDGKDFYLFKFRSMKLGSDKKTALTIGEKDERITRVGYFIRKYKIDELPQLINVLLGEMSLVGPRPEIRKYVNLYTEEQKQVLSVKPGITDYASIEYINENKLLGNAKDPETTYVYDIMQKKLVLNLKYIKEQSFITDIKIIYKTFSKIIQ